jgi:uncharacterized protein YyaL (SSP411 family)
VQSLTVDFVVWITGLMISGLSKAGQALKEPAFMDQAIKTATFLKTHMYDKDSSTLYRTSYVEENTITTGQVLG